MRNALIAASHRADIAFADQSANATASKRRVARESRWLQHPSGLVAKADTIQALDGDIELVFGKIVRGLFSREFGRPMSLVPMRAGLLTAAQAADVTRLLLQLTGAGVDRRFDGFWWSRATMSDDPDSGVWSFIVFDSVMVGAWTGAASPFAPSEFAKGVIEGGHPDGDPSRPGDV